MAGSRTVDAHKRRRMATTLVAMLAPLLLLTAPAAAQESPPVISNPHISPATLPSSGGTVTVSADVVDDISVFSVGANAYGPGSSLFAPMLLTDLDAGTYTGTFEIGPNFSEESVNHAIEVVAVDGTSLTTMEFIGDVEVAGTPPFDEAPIVWDPSVTPTSLPSGGGAVNLAVSAWDLRGISEAYAAITGPGGASYNVPLEGITADRFGGVFNAPANTSGSPAYYDVEFSALDDIGQQTIVSGGRITVAARSTAQLTVSPGSRSFGTVKRGQVAQRTIVVRYRGPRTAPPIRGRVQTSGAPFRVAGQTAAGVAFRLRPGEARTYVIKFRPTARGRFNGQVNVIRADAGQPGLHASLTGRGA